VLSLSLLLATAGQAAVGAVADRIARAALLYLRLSCAFSNAGNEETFALSAETGDWDSQMKSVSPSDAGAAALQSRKGFQVQDPQR